MSPRVHAWVMTLGIMLLAGLVMWLLLTLLMVGAYWSAIPLSESVTGALSNWPFTVGFGVLVGIGSLSGFSPEDL